MRTFQQHPPAANGRSSDVIAARIAEIAAQSKARAEAGKAVLGSVGAPHRLEGEAAEGWPGDDSNDEADDEDFDDVELSLKAIGSLSLVITDLLCSGDATFIKINDKLTDALLRSRPAAQWANVLRDVTLKVPVSVDLTFSAYTLRILRNNVTLYEAVRALGPSWERVGLALRKLAQSRLFEACWGTRPTVPLEALLQAGARLFDADDHQRTAAHCAALAGSTMLGRLVQAAPALLVLEDCTGATPLSLASSHGLLDDPSCSLDLVDAAFTCMAALPNRTAAVLGSNVMTATAWAQLATVNDKATLMSAWDGEPGPTCSAAEAAAEARSGLADARLRQRAQRIAVLGEVAGAAEAASASLEVEELQLRLAQAEEALKKEREAARKREEEQEKELQRLRSLVALREEELVAAKQQCPPGRQAGVPLVPLPAGPVAAPAQQTPLVDAAAADSCDTDGPQELRVVKKIREARLVGVDPAQLPANLRTGVVAMQASLRAAVERLSHDLYESEAHFLQELLQNADDNSYEASVPSLRFVLRRGDGAGQQDFFFAENNERGLTEADVQALCDISRSSKSASSGRTIGCKGVGWKSVFCICDYPHVLSQGWRFRFVAQGLGMLTPEWLEEADYEGLPAEVRSSHTAGNTVIYLPLRDSQAVPGIEAEMKSMSQDATQLLFLRRLQVVRFTCSKSTVCLSVGQDDLDGVRRSTLREEEGQEEAPVRTDFKVSSRDDVTVAMPLVAEPCPQRIFAFLPVRSVGFRFAVQAPFHLTASRAGIHLSPENLRRRNLVVSAFLDACRSDERIGAKALNFLGMAPSEPFWLPVYESVLEGLKHVACVETESGPVEPEACLLRGNDPAASWVPGEVLQQACGLKFALPGTSPHLCRDLGLQSFGVQHLLACLSHADCNLPRSMWQSASRSAFFSDVFASLADALQQDPSRLAEVQALALFPVAGVAGVSWASAEQVYTGPCELLPKAWQVPLVRCLDPDLQLQLRGWRLLDLLAIQAVTEGVLLEAAVSCLLEVASSKGRSPFDSATLWAALAVLCRCFVLGKEPPVPWTALGGALLLPSSSGELLPSLCLRLRSLCGVELRLPPVVLDRVCGFAGIRYTLEGVGGLERVAVPVLKESPGNSLDWEVFLHALGCSPLDPSSDVFEGFLEVSLQLGDVLCSGDFWREAAKSAVTLSYLEKVLGLQGPGLVWLRRLPVHLNGETLALEDLFLVEAFHGIAGEHLPYMYRVPEELRVRSLLKHLGVSVDVDVASLMKCLRCLKGQMVEDLGLAAEIYSRLGHLGFDAGVADFAGEELILVPDQGFLHIRDCSWLPFHNSLLQRCCRLEALQELYSRFGPSVQNAIQRWVRRSPEEEAGELCDALLRAVRSAKAPQPQSSAGKPPVQPIEAVEGLFAASKAVVSKLTRLCLGDSPEAEAHANTAFGFFVEHRMIVLPSIDDDECQCTLLHRGEAYWSVAPDLQDDTCAMFSLERHYGPSSSVQVFFTEVLKVRSMLTANDLRRLYISRGSGPSVNGDVSEGLAFLQPSSRWSRHQGPSRTPAREGSSAASAGPPLPPREWRWAGQLAGLQLYSCTSSRVPWQPRTPDPSLLLSIISSFGLHHNQVAFAYDPSGRCVCDDGLFLSVMQLRQAALMPTERAHRNFWAAELAHAVAHQMVGPQFSEELMEAQNQVLVQALEVLSQGEGPYRRGFR